MIEVIFDNHMHLSPYGKFTEAVRLFRKYGGTHMLLVHKPYKNIKVKDYESIRKAYELTLKLAKRIRSFVNVYVALGLHPVELLNLMKIYGLEVAVDIYLRGIELASEYVMEGMAVAIGEVGRPHFKVSNNIITVFNEVLIETFKIAKEADCAVILHTERASEETFKKLSELIHFAGYDVSRVVKHFSPPLILPKENYGIVPSILANKKNIRLAIQKGNRFLMETDYIDEPEKPNAVLPPYAVPKVTNGLYKAGVLSDEDLYVIHRELPEKVYKISLT